MWGIRQSCCCGGRKTVARRVLTHRMVSCIYYGNMYTRIPCGGDSDHALARGDFFTLVSFLVVIFETFLQFIANAVTLAKTRLVVTVLGSWRFVGVPTLLMTVFRIGAARRPSAAAVGRFSRAYGCRIFHVLLEANQNEAKAPF